MYIKNGYLGKVSLIQIYEKQNIAVKKFCRKDWLNNPEKASYRGSLESCFMRELTCLKALKNHPNFPQIIDFDESRLIIVMEYCGERLNLKENNTHLAPQIETIVEVLKKKQILIDHYSPTRSQEFARFYKSLLLKNGRLHLVDFETCVSLPLMKPAILTERLIQRCKKCDYSHLSSEMKLFVMGKNSELLTKYLEQVESRPQTN